MRADPPPVSVQVLGPVGLRLTLRPGAAYAILDRIERNLRRTRPFFARAGILVRRGFAETFAAGGRPRWAPLSPRTVREKERSMGGGSQPRRLRQRTASGETAAPAHAILIRTGALRDSWCQLGARGNVQDIGEEEATYGSQLTVDQTEQRGRLTPETVRGYHVLRRYERRALSRGGTARRRIPLTTIHELGSDRAKIPARPVAVPREEDAAALAGLLAEHALAAEGA